MHNLYFHDPDLLLGQALPLFAECRRRRSFRPLLPLPALLPLFNADAAFFHAAIAMPWDRDVFQALVGQTLILAARRVPSLNLDLDTLIALLAPDRLNQPQYDRTALSLAERLFIGSRDLIVGHLPFRPLQIGWNNQRDVQCLNDYFQALDPQSWKPDALVRLSCAPTAEDREHELGIVLDSWPELVALLRDAVAAGHVIVCEQLGEPGA